MLAPNQEWKFPDEWNRLCAGCMVLRAMEFARENGLTVTLFPALQRSSRLQIFLHPNTVKIPFGEAVPFEMVNRYWIFGLETLPMKCTCGGLKNNDKETINATGNGLRN